MTGTDDRPRMVLEAFKAMPKGTLRGFATVKLPNQLTIADCPVFIANGRAWATLPGKPVIDRASGRHVEADGKKRYSAILAWPDRGTADRWSDAVVALVRQAHPGALDEGGPP
jgi:hypothetical protein